MLWFCRLPLSLALPFLNGITLVADALRKLGLASVEEAGLGSPKYGEAGWTGVLVDAFGGVGARPVDGSNFSLKSCTEFSRGLRNMAGRCIGQTIFEVRNHVPIGQEHQATYEKHGRASVK